MSIKNGQRAERGTCTNARLDSAGPFRGPVCSWQKLAQDLAESGTSSMLGRQYVSLARVTLARWCHPLRVASTEGGRVPFRGNPRKVAGCPAVVGAAEVGGLVLNGVEG